MNTRVKQSKLAVIEIAEWSKHDRITSVKPALEVLCKSFYPEPTFSYSTFVNKYAFLCTLLHYGNQHGVQYVYIACHGEEDHLNSLYDGDEITAKDIDECLSDAGKSSYKGIYFGSCLFVKKAAQVILNSKNYNMGWVAGYSGMPDWCRSGPLDMLFWGKMIVRSAGGREPKIKDVVETLQKECRGLMHGLDFHVYVKRHGKIIDLVNP
ncbi:MAG: hypothetical protein OXU98_11555 [Gammaproteobacteria bacterium]|nr:hypothetical protein [Gammaproteobacteria bacterium]